MNNKINIIVPYRDRQTHLDAFLPWIEKKLKEEELEYNIFIIEQADDKPFNRGKLLNIGYKTVRDLNWNKEPNEIGIICCHDVDMLMLNGSYRTEGVTHLATEVQQFDYKMPYADYFGGVTCFDVESFEAIGGYPNSCWGWGAEDDMIRLKCEWNQIKILRTPNKFQSLYHRRDIDEKLYNQNLQNLNGFKNTYKTDGLSDLNYELVDGSTVDKEQKIFHIKVKI